MRKIIRADNSTELSYFCIQVDEGSLVQSTQDDGIIPEEKPVSCLQIIDEKHIVLGKIFVVKQ